MVNSADSRKNVLHNHKKDYVSKMASQTKMNDNKTKNMEEEIKRCKTEVAKMKAKK